MVRALNRQAFVKEIRWAIQVAALTNNFRDRSLHGVCPSTTGRKASEKERWLGQRYELHQLSDVRGVLETRTLFLCMGVVKPVHALVASPAVVFDAEVSVYLPDAEVAIMDRDPYLTVVYRVSDACEGIAGLGFRRARPLSLPCDGQRRG